MPLPPHVRRIRVVGISGSGKTTLARQIARRTGSPHLELDAVFWDAGWTMRDLEEAHAVIDRFVDAHPEGWVMDGNWTSRLGSRLDPGTPDGADLIVWLDHPRRVVMARIIRRTLRRGILREELWHGNRERPSSWLSRDPERNIIRWTWTHHGTVRERMTERLAAGWPVVRLTSRREVAAWLAALGSAD